MITDSLSAKVRMIQIRTRKNIASGFAGGYKSAFKGRGLEFDEVREYAPGDDVRDIDWNVTARTGRPFVKRYIEERQLKIIFAVDVSRSLAFGTAGRRKTEAAAEFCSLVAFSAIRNNDCVGLLLFTREVEKFVPPAKGSSHALRLLRDILAFKPRDNGTDIAAALDYLGRVMHRRSVVFLVSDFFSPAFDRSLRLLARRHDLIAVRVSDPREASLPESGLVELYDPESGRRTLVDTAGPGVRDTYSLICAEREEQISGTLRSAGVDRIAISTDKECVGALVAFFRTREHRR